MRAARMAKHERSKLLYALSFATQLGFLIVGPLVGFIWLGVYLDRRLGSSPSFLLAGLFVALAVTAYETYQMLEPLMDKGRGNGKKG